MCDTRRQYKKEGDKEERKERKRREEEKRGDTVQNEVTRQLDTHKQTVVKRTSECHITGKVYKIHGIKEIWVITKQWVPCRNQRLAKRQQANKQANKQQHHKEQHKQRLQEQHEGDHDSVVTTT